MMNEQLSILAKSVRQTTPCFPLAEGDKGSVISMILALRNIF